MENVGDKRFTDVNKWTDEWFAELSPEHKLFWSYLCDTCDQAGIWNRSKKLTKGILCLPDFDFEKALTAFGDRIQVLVTGEWWLVKFVEFQNPKGLHAGANYHAPIFKSAEKYGLDFQHLVKGSSTHDQPLVKGTPRDQDKDKDKDKDIVKVKDLELNDFDSFWKVFPNRKAKADAKKAWGQMKPDLKAVLEALSWQTGQEQWTKDKGKYVPLPASWLRGQRWEDERPYQSKPIERIIPKTMGEHFKVDF